MVSPPSKNGADVVTFPQRTRAASDGSAVQFASLIGFGDVHGSGLSFDYMGVRSGVAGTRGWSTHGITPGGLEALPFVDQLLSTGFDTTYRGEMSSDLASGVFGTFSPLTPGSPNTDQVMNLYVRDDLRAPGPGTYRLVTACPVCSDPLTGSVTDQPEVAGASADFSHIIFETTQNLTSEAASLDPTVPKLYEWTDGVVRLAGILPDGTPAPNSEAGQGALSSSSVTSSPRTYVPNAISRDGSRIYFTQRVTDASSGRLYLRTANGTAAASTVQVNVAEPTPNPSPFDDAEFWAATPDGSKVLFTTKENLLSADTSDANLTDLYLYDVNQPPGHHLTLVSAPDGGHSADVQGVIGMGDQGDYVYFVSTQQLLIGEPPNVGVDRIFVWHDGLIHEVAAVPSTLEDLTPLFWGGWRDFPKTSRLSADGHVLAFTSRNAGGGASDDLPHTGVGDACVEPGGCEEVYAYDAIANGPPICVSCHRPDSPAQTDASFLARSATGPAGFTSHLNHPLSADGRFVFFTASDRLAPDDLDGTEPDVYEYDRSTGQLHLLSGGRAGSFGAFFMDASADGHDVFFTSRDQLNGWDGDAQVDLYDARVGGGLPEPASSPPACSGDACHGTQGPVVGAGEAPSAAIHSANRHHRHRGRHCRKGHVRRHVRGKVRCLKRHRHRHRSRHTSGERGRR